MRRMPLTHFSLLVWIMVSGITCTGKSIETFSGTAMSRATLSSDEAGVIFDSTFKIWFTEQKYLSHQLSGFENEALMQKFILDHDRGIYVFFYQNNSDAVIYPIRELIPKSLQNGFSLVSQSVKFNDHLEKEVNLYVIQNSSATIIVETFDLETPSAECFWTAIKLNPSGITQFVDVTKEFPVFVEIDKFLINEKSTWKLSSIEFCPLEASIFEIPQESQEQRDKRLRLAEELSR